MARRAKSINLPWKQEKDGLVAELGAVFRVELKDGGWQCSVKTGRRTEVLEEGLGTKKEGKARAEAHAARMPEVAGSSAGEDEAPAKRTRRGTGRKTATRAKREPKAAKKAPAAATEASANPAPEPAAGGAPELTYQKLDDGCLFGRAAGACWVASEREVVFARPVDPALEAKVRELAAQHYAAARAAKKAEREAERAEREAERAAARTEREAARAAAKAEREAAKTASKKTAKKATKTAAKTTKTAAQKTAKKGPRGRKAKSAGKGAAEKEGEPVAKKANGKDTAPAVITWTEKDGEQRGAAAHGTFLIQPEGERFSLYFYEPGGQSRHLRSGDARELRKAAEEMAARGQPAPEREAISADKEEAMLRMFVSGAVEGG